MTKLLKLEEYTGVYISWDLAQLLSNMFQPKQVQREMVNYKGCGMSVMEMSHRSKEFMAIAAEAEKNLRDIFGVPSDRDRVKFTA